jgi:hypothetical protein
MKGRIKSMSSGELAKRISHWLREYDFCSPVVSGRAGNDHVVAFTARTTKTRASSIVTRICLIAEEIASGREFEAGKELVGDPPEDRAGLASWRIYVRVPVRRRSEAAA